MKLIYSIVPREDHQGVFYSVETVNKSGGGTSIPFDQKPSAGEVEAHLKSIYPEMTEIVRHINHSQSREEIASVYF
jgi:hypothetical protein